jgi:spore maturation protein CgeB
MNIYSCLIVEEESNLWHRNFTDTLRRMGHKVFIPVSIGLRESWCLLGGGVWTQKKKKELTEKIFNDVKSYHQREGVDIFLCYLFPFQFESSLFTELNGLSIPSVYFFCDNFAHMEVAQTYAPKATLNWVPEINTLEKFRESNSKFIYLPMAGNPNFNYPVSLKETVDLSFVGTKNPYRRHLLGQVLSSGMALRVYGDGWYPYAETYHSLEGKIKLPTLSYIERVDIYLQRRRQSMVNFLKYGFTLKRRQNWFHKLGKEYEMSLQAIGNKEPLSYSDINRVYSFSSVSLGVNDQFNIMNKERMVFYTKLRDFEATMAGACHLTQHTPEGAEFFVDDKEIMTYRTFEELLDKANFLLKNETFRGKMRLAARQKSLSQHTWEHRFKKIFSELGFLN